MPRYAALGGRHILAVPSGGGSGETLAETLVRLLSSCPPACLTDGCCVYSKTRPSHSMTAEVKDECLHQDALSYSGNECP